jgi:STAS-like domain of unknown function (DUF4325)
MLIVNVAKEFTRFPGGRSKKFGETSGEAFRERFLEAPIQQGQRVSVELDGTIGYSSSFLEEAFGGLVRKLHISANDLWDKLDLITTDQALVKEVSGYIQDASAQSLA